MISQDIVEPSQIAAIRRWAVQFGSDIGLPGEALDRVALVVTEAGTNLMRHATEGKILVLESHPPGQKRLHIVAVDSGPGIPSVEKAMQDGFTTAPVHSSGMGTGLGAISRQSDRLDIYTDQDGTVLVATIASRPCEKPEAPRIAGLIVPKPGFSVGGDAWAVRNGSGSELVMLIDVLGHGPKAGGEAAKALEGFLSPVAAPSLENSEAAVSEALAADRGAAVLIVEAGESGQPLKAVGLGNIRGEILIGSERRGIPSSPGISGAAQRRPHPTEHDWPAGAVLLLTTDGLKSTQRLPEPQALLYRDALTIAAAIYQRRRRDTDDCGVVVLKARP